MHVTNFLPTEKSLDFQNYRISQSKEPKHNYIFDVSKEVYQFIFKNKTAGLSRWLHDDDSWWWLKFFSNFCSHRFKTENIYDKKFAFLMTEPP